MSMIKIRKRTTTIILRDYEVADSITKRAKGIMFRKRITRPMLFIFNGMQNISIHSFFCPLFDAIFLDEKRRVIDIHQRIKPNRILSSSYSAKYLVELPVGDIKKKKIVLGSLMSW